MLTLLRLMYDNLLSGDYILNKYILIYNQDRKGLEVWEVFIVNI